MNTTLVSTGKQTAELQLTIEPTDYKDLVKEELKQQAKKANIPGFRPGKVPIGMVRRMVGKSVVIDVLNKLVNQSLSEYIKEEKLNLVGDPLPTEQKSEEDFDANAEKEMTFSFNLGLAPEFELNLELADLPKRHEIEIDEAYLNDQLDHYQERFGGVTNPEVLEEGDIFYGRIYDPAEEGEEGFSQMVPFNPMRIENEEFFKAYFGAKVDDEFDFKLTDVSEDEEKLAELLFLDKEKIEAFKETPLKLQVKRMNRLGKAELNEEFFARMAEEFGWGEEDLEGMDEESFKTKLKENLTEPLTEQAKWFYRNLLRDQILDNHLMEFPDEFLKEWMEKSSENMNADQVEAQYPDYIRSLSWSLIVDKIVEANPEIEINDSDVQSELLNNLRSQFMRMGSALPPEREQEFLQLASQNQEMVNNAVQQVVARKVFDLLDEQIIPENEPISATDFRTKVEELEAQRMAEQLEAAAAAKLEEASEEAPESQETKEEVAE